LLVLIYPQTGEENNRLSIPKESFSFEKEKAENKQKVYPARQDKTNLQN